MVGEGEGMDMFMLVLSFFLTDLDIAYNITLNALVLSPIFLLW
jgi:hypothetical protein